MSCPTTEVQLMLFSRCHTFPGFSPESSSNLLLFHDQSLNPTFFRVLFTQRWISHKSKQISYLISVDHKPYFSGTWRPKAPMCLRPSKVCSSRTHSASFFSGSLWSWQINSMPLVSKQMYFYGIMGHHITKNNLVN